MAYCSRAGVGSSNPSSYIGVPVEHRRDPVEVESWAEALSRFDGDASADAVAADDETPPVPDDEGGGAGVLCPDCGERFDSRHGLATHRGLVHE
ncbi:MAG: hypothetical protein ABEH77_08130 [Halobacteriaceae archaeon]